MLCKSRLQLCFLCIQSCSWVNLHCSAQKQFVSLSPQLDSWWPGAKIMFTPQIKMDFVSCFVSTYVTHYYIYSTVNSRNSHPKISKVLVDLPHWYINQRKYMEYVFSKRWWIFLRFIKPFEALVREGGSNFKCFLPVLLLLLLNNTFFLCQTCCKCNFLILRYLMKEKMKSDLANYRVLGKCYYYMPILLPPIIAIFSIIGISSKLHSSTISLDPIHDFHFNSFPSLVVFLATSFVLLVEQDVVLTRDGGW